MTHQYVSRKIPTKFRGEAIGRGGWCLRRIEALISSRFRHNVVTVRPWNNKTAKTGAARKLGSVIAHRTERPHC